MAQLAQVLLYVHNCEWKWDNYWDNYRDECNQRDWDYDWYEYNCRDWDYDRYNHTQQYNYRGW
ncbi:hypothetical protein EC957_005230 [Mortierella hygrophila]|uniref:Uncharacterized protein n=1 Tax=Mortierella hygrophila TaxID=979708 RepID=A0A9P6JZU4_9FUNG|nr:hypothetical protein EC957_005230 [Mortierella hygrophila]